MPLPKSEQPHAIRFARVSAFFADVIQQIHSLRASGVIARHVASASELSRSADIRSAGSVWTTPPGIFVLIVIAALAEP